jgi:arginine/ornithine N-succinyltransferase beta subunit
MTDFSAWRYENLVQFAKEATERMTLLNAEVDALNADLKTAINAYRDLLRRDSLGFLETSHSTETKKTGE